MYDTVPLHFLSVGQRASVDQLVGSPNDVHRLEELGLSSGTMVEMVQSGSPCIIRLGNSKLCFRESDVIGVLVRTGDDE